MKYLSPPSKVAYVSLLGYIGRLLSFVSRVT
jgi:hypothetical protein